MGRRVGHRKAEEEPIAELLATTTTQRGARPVDAQQARDLRDTPWPAPGAVPHAARPLGVSSQELTTPSGRDRGHVPGAPKGQPPRNLSGIRDRRDRRLWSLALNVTTEGETRAGGSHPLEAQWISRHGTSGPHLPSRTTCSARSATPRSTS